MNSPPHAGSRKILSELVTKHVPRPKPSLSQNFMVEPKIIETIVSYAQTTRKETVLEIGTGLGFLTEKISERAGKVLTIEKDPQLFRVAKKRLEHCENVELIRGDVLRERLPNLDKVVSNPPFNISFRLMRLIFNHRPELVVMTLQKSFLDKVAARPGQRIFGYVSLLIQFLYAVEQLDVVSKNCFVPPSNFPVQIARLRRLSTGADWPIIELASKISRVLFTQRKRTLRSALSHVFQKSRLHIDDFGHDIEGPILRKRVYELSPMEVVQLTEILSDSAPEGSLKAFIEAR